AFLLITNKANFRSEKRPRMTRIKRLLGMSSSNEPSCIRGIRSIRGFLGLNSRVEAHNILGVPTSMGLGHGRAALVSGSSSGRVHRRHSPQFNFAVAILITAETKREDYHHQHPEQQERIPDSVRLPRRDGGKPSEDRSHADADQHAHGI